jgi:diguanylate cyclase (GGDEF)-like protein
MRRQAIRPQQHFRKPAEDCRIVRRGLIGNDFAIAVLLKAIRGNQENDMISTNRTRQRRRVAMPESILIIDDSVPLHKLIKSYLAPEMLKIRSAYDGESGLAATANPRPSLILLDVDLPGIDGFEVCRRLKANPSTASIPIIFLTASALTSKKVKGLELGATDYIVKPFKPEELCARVRAGLRAKFNWDAITMVDGPTGLFNRVYLNSHVNMHISLAKRFDTPAACVMVRLDHYDALTARHGDAVMSDVIRAVARILLKECRTGDIVCRFDESKFVLLISNANRTDGRILAERLGAKIKGQLNQLGSLEIRATCSFGVSDTKVANGDTLIDRAESALAGPGQRVQNLVNIARETADGLTVAA